MFCVCVCVSECLVVRSVIHRGKSAAAAAEYKSEPSSAALLNELPFNQEGERERIAHVEVSSSSSSSSPP